MRARQSSADVLHPRAATTRKAGNRFDFDALKSPPLRGFARIWRDPNHGRDVIGASP
jgi:hypothetical protein